MNRIRRAHKTDAAAIGRVHVETWQATYAGLLPDAMLAGMSDVRQSAYWSRVLADPRRIARRVRGRRRGHGRGGLRQLRPGARSAGGPERPRDPRRRGLHALRRARLPEPRTRPAAARRAVPPAARRRLRHRRAVDAGRQSRRASSTRGWAASGWASASTPWPASTSRRWPSAGTTSRRRWSAASSRRRIDGPSSERSRPQWRRSRATSCR